MKCIRLFSALTAAVMSLTAVPLHVLADELAPDLIEQVSLSGAAAQLIRGEVPVYSMRLSDDCAAKMEITEEMWVNPSDTTPVYTRSGGETVSQTDTAAYRYAVVLQAADGYVFSDHFTLQYENVTVDPSLYAMQNYGTAVWFWCGFIPLTEPTDASPPLYGDLTQDGELSIADAVLLARLIADDETAPVSVQGMLAADVDRDGVLTITDVTDLLWYLSGHIAPDDPQYFDEAGAVDLPVPTIPYSPETEGNSQPFLAEPLPGLTLSAEANALSYDGQLTVTPLTEEKTNELNDQFDAYGVIVASGWEISAGLAADEHLPGSYRSAYDLTAAEIPETLYDAVRVMRVDDNGVIHQYPAKLEGSTLTWDSDQNSFVIIGILAIGAAVAANFSGMTIGAVIAVEVVAMLVVGAMAVWEISKGVKDVHAAEMYVNQLRFYETSHFKIWYAVGQTASEARKARLAAKENAARTRAYDEMLEIIGDSGKANSPKFHIETELRTRKYLAEDTEYQEMLLEIDRVPADVRMLAHQLETAYDYLSMQHHGNLVNQFHLNYKPDVLFTPSAETLGASITPKTGADPYLIVERRAAMIDDPLLIPANADIMDYYGTSINAKTADDLLITLTHEIFHIHQNKYYSGTDIAHLKASELSAMVLQNHAARYYADHGITTTKYEESVDKYFETYAVPFDEVLGEKEAQSAGYTLSHFWLYLEQKTGQKHPALEFIEAYPKHGYSITKTLSNLFGFGDDAEALAKYWRSFIASYADLIAENAYGLRIYDKDSQQGYPSRQHRIKLSSENQSVKVDFDAKDLTATEAVIFGTDGTMVTGTWQALIVKDESCLNMKDFGFVFPRNLRRQFVSTRTRNGAAIYPRSNAYTVIERQGAGNTGSGSYTVYLLMEPDAPSMHWDEETNEIVVDLKIPSSATAKDRATDALRLDICVDDVFTALRQVKYEECGAEIRISAYELGLPLDKEVTISAAVCEVVTGDAESITYYCPRSEKESISVKHTMQTTTAATDTTAVTTTLTTTLSTPETNSPTGTEPIAPDTSVTAEPTVTTETTLTTVTTQTTETSVSETTRRITNSTDSTAETTVTTETTDTTESTEATTTTLRVEPRDIQFSYLDGWYEDADVGGCHRKPYPNPNDEVDYMFKTAPHFRLFEDGTFEVTVYGDSGSNKGYYTYSDGEQELDEDYEWEYSGFTVQGRLLEDNTGKLRWRGIITHCTAPEISARFKEYDGEEYIVNTFGGAPCPLSEENADDYLYGEYDISTLEPVYGTISFEEIDVAGFEYGYQPSLTLDMATTGGEVYLNSYMFDTSKNKEPWFITDEEGDMKTQATLEFDLNDTYLYIERAEHLTNNHIRFLYYGDAYVFTVQGGSAKLATGETVTWGDMWFGGKCEQARNSDSWTGALQFTEQNEIPLLIEWDEEDENGETIHRQKNLSLEIIRPVIGTVTYSANTGEEMKDVTLRMDVLTDQGYITLNGAYSVKVPKKTTSD